APQRNARFLTLEVSESAQSKCKSSALGSFPVPGLPPGLKTLLVPTPRLRTGLFNRIVPPPGATKEMLRRCATSQVGLRHQGGLN
uniref:Uncharacterized protein n=1 Tax=Junco hyemalis TaxID=40217 RepID=A0A8C5IPG4_JUNHY